MTDSKQRLEVLATDLGPINEDNGRASQRLYRLDPPVPYGWGDAPDGHTEYVVVSATVAYSSGPETYIFPADKDGKIIDWGEMNGSYRGGLDHAEAIRNAGWRLA